MDDLEFRRRVMSDPKQKNSDFTQALSANESSRKLLDDVLSLDAKIADAMNVDVPDGLADRILFKQSGEADNDNVVTLTFTRKAMAMAASVVFVLGILVGQVNWGYFIVPPAQASLVDMAITHVTNEEPFISKLDEQVSSKQINAKLEPFSYQITSKFPYHVYYLNHCGFGRTNALHMVFQGEAGKVTLFITGIESEANINFSKKEMTGLIEPMGNKSLILVGSANEDMDKIAKNLLPILSPTP